MRAFTVVVAMAAVLTGCDSGPTIEAGTRKQLIADVDAVRKAAQRHDRAAAEAALAELSRDVAEAQAEGLLSVERAKLVLAAADRVAEDIRTLPHPVSSPRPPIRVTLPQPAPPPPSETAPSPISGPGDDGGLVEQTQEPIGVAGLPGNGYGRSNGNGSPGGNSQTGSSNAADPDGVSAR